MPKDSFDRLRDRLGEAVGDALLARLDEQPDGEFALHLRQKRKVLVDAWFDRERIRIKRLDSARRPGAE